MDELELIKNLFVQLGIWAKDNPALSTPIIVVVVLTVFLSGKFRGGLMNKIFDKMPFGKILERRYEKNLEEELKILKADEANLFSPNMPTVDKEALKADIEKKYPAPQLDKTQQG